ncbi:hypothetical protein C7271_03900 [filamentous cyanobacterium CCP5]|nr:hypothetical protein C7271_03900 [filamentous cyanobacterium CCP5]
MPKKHKAVQSHIQKRIFIVGCPRSGTTLLQSLLASHSQILSFPESQFFPYLFSNDQAQTFCNTLLENTWTRPLLRMAARKLIFGVARHRLHGRIEEFLDAIGQTYYLSAFPQAAVAAKASYTQAFGHVLDAITHAAGKTVWLEKSPEHLYYVEYITQQLPQPKFIHIVRHGPDTIASLYDVRKRYPEHWQMETASVELCTSRWLRDIRLSQRYRDYSDHVVIRYEDLVKHPKWMVAQLCQVLEITYEPSILAQYNQVAQQVSLPSEPWKQKVSQPIQNQNSTKFTRLFNSEQQQSILTRTASYDLDKIVTIKPPF